MPNYALPTPRRRRGRPAKGSGNTRERILAAAVEEFSQHGYDASTVRGIAARAEVDPALLHHYFGTKADLFGEAVGSPLRPDRELPFLLDGPREDLGERIVSYVLTAWEQPDTRKRGVVIMRSALGNRRSTPLLSGFLRRELLEPAAEALGVPDAQLRTSLAASQLAGLLVGRYILQLPALAEASPEELIARVAPVLQRYLVED